MNPSSHPMTDLPMKPAKGLEMLRRPCLVVLLGVAAMMAAPRTVAQSRPEPPDVMAFQGSLLGPDGTPIGGAGVVNYPMVFRVFTSDVGGTLLWSEQQTVTVRDGAFSVVLGEGNVAGNEPRPPLSSLFQSANASDRFVEMTVKGAAPGEADATVTPRTRLVTGPYSMVATRARTAQDMVNRDGQPLLRPVGDKVGINKSNPQATLDVAESLAARSWNIREGLTVTGNGEAAGFNGLGMAPVGSILMWTGSTPPMGWVLCDGAVVNGVATPDLRGRFVLASGGGQGLTARARGDVGGKESHALTEGEMPGHRHFLLLSGNMTEATEGAHQYRAATVGTVVMSNPSGSLNARLGNNTTDASGHHVHYFDIPRFTSSPSGSGRPHNNMPPFYVLAFIMRVR